MDLSKTIPTTTSRVVGDFRLVRLLGQGGFGSVYEGVHVTTGLCYAVKRLEASNDPERFEKEALYPARAARQSLHVVGIHSYFRAEDGDFYLVTDLVPHGDLARFLGSHAPLSVHTALEIGLGIVKGLAAIHKDGITHLDLKPLNVLMDQKDGQWIPKICDFGLARSTASVHVNQYGTVGYASPEHFDPRLARGHASDMFSLGMLLYELVAGVKAWEGTTITEYASWVARAVPPPPPSQHRPELQGRTDIDQLVGMLLEFDVTRRTLSAADVVERLSAALARTIVPPVERTTGPTSPPDLPGHRDGSVTPPPPVPTTARRWTRLVPLALVLVSVVGGLSVWAVMREDQRDTKPAAGVPEFRAEKYSAAFPLLLEEAEAGKADAQSALGTMLARGLGGIERKPDDARRWLQRAIDQDDDEARCALAGLWRTDALGTASPEQAQRLYSDVTRHPCGHLGLGELALADEDTPSKFDAGVRELEAAAQMGSAEAARRLGEVHMAWRIGPLLQGPWQPVTRDERRSEVARLRALNPAGSWLQTADLRRLRRLTVDFYESTTLYELEVGLGAGRVGALDYLLRQDAVTVVNGQATQIYGLNASSSLRIDTAPRAAGYLRFFMAAVQGPKGVFRIVDEVEDLPWNTRADAERQTSLAAAIRPWELGPSGAGGWRATGTVSYNAGLLVASFELRPNGMVDLEGREQLATQLPVAMEGFDDKGLRTTSAPGAPARTGE